VLYVGIDPGLDGGIVGVEDGDIAISMLIPTMKAGVGGRRVLDVGEMVDVVVDLKQQRGVFVVLEDIDARPGSPMSKQATLSFGQHHGCIVGLLSMGRVPFQLCRPKVWQRLAGVAGDGDVKDRVLAVVQRRLPALELTPGKRTKPHQGLADAAGMALAAMVLSPG